MDPFALQHQARRRISWLIALIVLAAVATALALGCVCWLAGWGLWNHLYGGNSFPPAVGPIQFAHQHPAVLIVCFLQAAVFVLGGLLFELFNLSSGDNLMRRMGAVQLVRARLTGGGEADLARLCLFNVCEEMAIASGLDMPSVWVLESDSRVNALAAGTDPSVAAVCVTDGALRYLTRDELQGVVAHEFSHILNGDMRLNFRLTALVSGISLVSRTGKEILGLLFSQRDDSCEYRRRRCGLPLPLLVVAVLSGIAFCLIGSVGAFFARLVQSAVSRDREFLADAAAAQFTRNPEGLANALRLAYLADADSSGRIFRAWRADVAHMMFLSADFRLLATHPPVQERVRRLSSRGLSADEDLKRRLQDIKAARKRKAQEVNESYRQDVLRACAPSQAGAGGGSASVPREFLPLVRTVPSAGALLKELLGEPGTHEVGRLSPSERRALAFRCVTTLRDGLSADERKQWADAVWDLVVRDGRIDSFEMVVSASVRRHLLGRADARTVPGARLLPVAASVIATVAAFGAHPEAGYRAAGKRLSLFGGGLPPMPPAIGDTETFFEALEQLSALPGLAKKELLFALREAAAEDGTVQQDESDYIAAIADAIGAFGWLQTMQERDIMQTKGE